MTAIFSDHFSIVYDICRAACHGDTALGRSSVKKLAALIESSTPDDAALLKRLTKKATKNPANFVQTSTTDDARDAERYRWLRKEHFPTADNPPLAQVVWKSSDNRRSSKWVNLINGNDLDSAIDAALTAAQSGDKS